jgi:hypothetical protein
MYQGVLVDMDALYICHVFPGFYLCMYIALSTESKKKKKKKKRGKLAPNYLPHKSFDSDDE